MPSQLDPRLRSFLLRLPLAGAAALAVWFFGGISAPWTRAVIAVAETGIRSLERPPTTFVKLDDAGTVEYWRSDFSTRSSRPARDPAALTGNLVFLLTLLWATPGKTTGTSLARAAAAVLLLLASQALHLALAVETTWATDLGAWSEYAYPRWQREAFAAGRYFFDIAGRFALPPFLWGLLVVVPRLTEDAAAAAAAEATDAAGTGHASRRKENAAPRGARRRRGR